MLFTAKFEASWHYAWGDLCVFWWVAATRVWAARFAGHGVAKARGPRGTAQSPKARRRCARAKGVAMLDADLLQTVEIAQQLLPFRRDLRLAHEVLEMLLHGERQEGAEHMTADG